METKTTDKTHKTNKPALTGNWEPQNKLRLERLIAEKAFADNYAVFDWDYTCIFYDIQDSLFLYQLEHLCFNLAPLPFGTKFRRIFCSSAALIAKGGSSLQLIFRRIWMTAIGSYIMHINI